MVFDKLEHASLYYGLGPRFRQALEWLAQVDPAALPSGQRVDIDGDNIYATRFDVDTKRPEEAKLECHRNYADIQYVVSGTEGVGYALPDAHLNSSANTSRTSSSSPPTGIPSPSGPAPFTSSGPKTFTLPGWPWALPAR